MPASRYATIQVGHGGGGRLMQELLDTIFIPAFRCPELSDRHDSAVMDLQGGRLAFTTDGYVVSPLFFPGGDIGRLAVFGTCNDLAMAGARPIALAAAFIAEEGLPIEVLARLAGSMRDAAAQVGVRVVTGDTKVVERGKGDGLFVTTAGIGMVPAGVDVRPARIQPGDAVIVSGDLGRHGIAILAAREQLGIEGTLASDCAPLGGLVAALLEAAVQVHCLRDLTRGGLAAALNEIASASGAGIEVDERLVPLSAQVAGACEILGLDPLYVACEGRLVAFVPERDAARALVAMRSATGGSGAAVVGRVTERGAVPVIAIGPLGGRRTIDLPSGELLPRIC